MSITVKLLLCLALAVCAHGQIAYSTQPAPTPPVSGMTLWLDATCIGYSAGCTTPSNGANVSSWHDKSGNGNPMAVGAGTTPTFATSQINSLPAVSFTNCRCTLTSIPVSTGYSAFLVFKLSSISGTNTVISNSAGGAFEWYFGTSHQALNSAQLTVIGVGSATVDTTAWHQANVTFVNNSATVVFRYGGASDALTGSATSANMTAGNNIFADHGVSDINLMNGLVAEFIFYNRVLSASEIATVEAYLLAKYGV